MKNSNTKKLKQLMEQHGYKLESTIKIDESERFNGIFYDRGGKKYFVKATFGKNNYTYKSLYSELQITHYLSTLTKKVQVKHKGYRLCIPAVAKTIDQDGFFCFITEFVEGKKLSQDTSETQATMLFIASELVMKLSSQVYMSPMSPYLKKYTRDAMLISLPIRFLKAVILSPLAIRGLIFVFRKSLSLFLTRVSGYGLVHADINASNIILRNKTVYLTDWEEAGWGLGFYNAITPLCVHWKDQVVRDTLLRQLQKSQSKSVMVSLLAYRTLMLFNQRMKEENTKRKRDLMILQYFIRMEK